ncbi:MAG: hypothetical protein DHS20C02_12410 [Micavibrio sp.]|nr:MAG: hypothetical protein DHS20C02_12410 [Micavibrio sp.]
MTLMTDAPIPEVPMEAPPEEKNPYAEKYKDFVDAIESLYIKGNISGRLHFRKSWPQAASHIFCAELIKYDEEGPEDKEHRAKLEAEAEERRMILVEALDDFEHKSVYHGSLQPDHVKKTIMALGRKIALYVYATELVDDIIPPGPDEKIAEAEETNELGQQEAGHGDDSTMLEPPVVDELSPTPVTDLPPLEDDVQPIDVSPPSAEPATEKMGESEGGSGLNLGAKRNIVQVDFIYSDPISYKDLVADAEKEESDGQEKAIPQPGIEASDPPVPSLQSAEAAVASPTQAMPLKMIFNQLAAGRVE